MITLNETLQLNELLTLKSLSLTKILLMSPMVTDPVLKEMFTAEASLCEDHIKELRSYMEGSTVHCEETVNNFAKDGGSAT